jgi:transposase
MGTASIHEGVRRMRFSSLLDRTEAKELTQVAASELLGINVRTFQRWAERYEAEGDDGLVDLRMGRRSPRRAPEEELERMLRQNASILGQGCSGHSPNSENRRHQITRHPLADFITTTPALSIRRLWRGRSFSAQPTSGASSITTPRRRKPDGCLCRRGRNSPCSRISSCSPAKT